MKKASILFRADDAETTIADVRALGVLHVEHQNPPEGPEVSTLEDCVATIQTSLAVLDRLPPTEKRSRPEIATAGDWRTIADSIIDRSQRLESLESSSRNLFGQIREWERWGDVDTDRIQALTHNGIYCTLYQVPVDEIGNFPDDIVVKTIFTLGDMAHCVAISRRQFDCTFTEILPPKDSVSRLRQQLAANEKEREEIATELTGYAGHYDDLVRVKKNMEKDIEYRRVVCGTGKEGAIGYVTGYIPIDAEQHLTAHARSRRWGIMIADPSSDDNVPTLIRNPRWVEKIEPVLNLLGITPGYRELDVSMLFLVFFCIFFGILIGDAGYGLVYILVTLVLQKKVQTTAEVRKTLSLFYLLGSSAILWGILTGTFFGQAWVLNMGIRPLVPQLNDAAFMQSLCFFLGALHLSLAHAWRAFLKYPSLTALADVGYICILWAAFFLTRTLILGVVFPTYGIWLVGVGIVLVVVFTSPQPRVLRGIGEGLGTMALSFMNNITDVISYIRLFAVNMASLAVAETTNFLAAGFGSGVVAVVAGFVIVLCGHGLNLILGLMSVLVHGVRLNVLEFSGHANVTWSGFAFEPLKE